MSSSVYPTLPGLEWNVKRTIIMPKVQVRTTPSDREYRARDAVLPRYQYTLSYEFLRGGSLTEWQTLSGFFEQMGGDFDSFLFTDPDDNAVAAQSFGTGNGAATAFQLVRALGGFVIPVTDLNGAPSLYTAAYGGLARVNLLLRSQAFNADATWAKNLCTASDNSGTAPDGTNTAATISSSAAGNTFLSQVRATTGHAGQSFTFSVWLKAGTAPGSFVLRLRDGASVEVGAATVTPTASWQRFSVTGTFGPSPAANIVVYVDPSTNAAAAGETFQIWGAQLEDGSAVSPGYIATGTTAYSYSLASGLATYTVAPPSGSALTWTGSFYRRCRFLRGQLELNKFMQDYWEAKKVELLSLKAGSS